MSLEEGVDDQRESVLKYQLSNNQTIIFEFLSFQINEKDNTFEALQVHSLLQAPLQVLMRPDSATAETLQFPE